MGDYEWEIRKIARVLIGMHGRLVEACCISGHNPGHIGLAFEDGHEIVVGKHSLRVDITMIKFGYDGTGTRCFHAFLDECGFKTSYFDLKAMQGPVTLRP